MHNYVMNYYFKDSLFCNSFEWIQALIGVFSKAKDDSPDPH